MPYTHLLVPTDGSELSARALDQAIALAQALGARITVQHVQLPVPLAMVGMGDYVDPATLNALIEAAGQQAAVVLEQAVARVRGAGVAVEQRAGLNASVHEAIVTAASQLGCDLIVMASHGRRGFEGLLLGSETQKVLTHSPCPVLVVR
jgi:nucleotide-binding universal stress UspA family protein